MRKRKLNDREWLYRHNRRVDMINRGLGIFAGISFLWLLVEVIIIICGGVL